MADQRSAPKSAEKSDAGKPPEASATKAGRAELLLSRAAGSSDAAVHDLLARRSIAVLNADNAAIDEFDQELAKLVD